MIPPETLYLVGPMGAGKTTIGRHLAKFLQREFVDLDAEIEVRCGADIPWIFDVEGEQGFRDRESALLQEVAGRQGLVVATGGGIVLRAENRLLLKEHGLAIYLSVTPRELYERTRNDLHRPLLQVPNRRAVIDRLVESIRASGAIRAAMQEARSFVGRGLDALTGMPEGVEKQALINLAQYIVEREL